MINTNNHSTKSIVIGSSILLILYAVGLIGTLIGYESLLKLSAINLLLSLLIVLWYQPKTKPFIVYAFVVYLAGYLVELAGVVTGKIFGQYFYGENLGFKLFDVPLIIGVNWLLLSYSSLSVTAFFAKRVSVLSNPFLFALIATVFMVFIDVLIEPLCARLDFWFWKGGQVPFTNFTAWFMFAFAFNFLGVKLGVHTQNKVAIVAWILQVVFFLGLTIFLV